MAASASTQQQVRSWKVITPSSAREIAAGGGTLVVLDEDEDTRGLQLENGQALKAQVARANARASPTGRTSASLWAARALLRRPHSLLARPSDRRSDDGKEHHAGHASPLGLERMPPSGGSGSSTRSTTTSLTADTTRLVMLVFCGGPAFSRTSPKANLGYETQGHVPSSREATRPETLRERSRTRARRELKRVQATAANSPPDAARTAPQKQRHLSNRQHLEFIHVHQRTRITSDA